MAVIFTFYRNFIWFVNFISLFGCYLVVIYGSWMFLITVFWIKVVTNITLGLYVHIFHSQQYTFFYNLGYDKLRLYGFTFLLDMLIWMTLSVATTQLLL